MEIQQLIYLKEIARLESFSKASETLNVTQSTLSKSIGKLESELGTRLFERMGNTTRLNKFGQTLLHYGDQALTSLESGMTQVRGMAELENNTVRFGVSADVFIKHLTRDFLLQHPDASVHCLLQSKEQMTASLIHGTADFCLSMEQLQGPDLIWQPLYEDHLTVLVSHDHPLAHRKSASLSEFSNDRFIITNLGYGMHSSTYDLCHKVGFQPKIMYEGYDTEIANQLIEAGLAVEITPHSISEGVYRFLNLEGKPMLARVSLNDSFTHKTIGCITQKRHYHTSASRAFIDYITDYFSSLK